MTATKGKDGIPGKYNYNASIELSLFDMENDPFETNNVIEKYPEVAKKLIDLAQQHKEKFFSENATKQ